MWCASEDMPKPGDLAQDLRAAGAGPLDWLQNQDRRAFSQDQPPAIG